MRRTFASFGMTSKIPVVLGQMSLIEKGCQHGIAISAEDFRPEGRVFYVLN